MVYPRYSVLFPELKTERDQLEQDSNSLQQQVEDEAANTPDDQAIKHLSAYSHRAAQSMLDVWNQLAQRLIVKYNDMAIKRTNEQGQYEKTPGGNQRPVLRPGYPEAYRKRIVEETGNRFLSK